MGPETNPSLFSPSIDVRPESAFVAGHVPGSANIALEELAARSHELPAASTAVEVSDCDPARAHKAAEFLRRRGHAVVVRPWAAADATQTGSGAVRLWKPAAFLVESLDLLPSHGTPPGRALDVACGSGRDAVYLALAGYDVEAIDLLPDALARADDLARRSGVAIQTRVRDLEREPALATERYDLVVVFRYLQRSLFPALRQAVRPGGHIVYETFHEQNRATGRRPLSPAHLLQTGELEQAFAGFEVLIRRDAFEREGRCFSSLLARKP